MGAWVKCCTWGLVAVLLGAGPALAQTPPLSNNDPVRALPKVAASAPELDIVRPKLTGGPEASPQFVLTRVEFFGAKTARAVALDQSWAPFKGRTVRLSDLRAIAARAEAAYAKAGFPFVAVIVPAQPVVQGVVRLQVVEGRISDLTVISSDAAARRQATIAMSPLVNRTPLSISDVETAYEQAKDIPGLAIAGALRRGSQPGGMDLVLDARETAFRSYLNVNNFYAPELGRWGVLAGFDYNGASRYGDQTSLQLFTTGGAEQSTIRLSHFRRLNTAGTAVSVAVLYSTADPKGVFQPLDLATKATDARFEVSQPLIRRTAGALTVAAALEVEDQDTRVFRTVSLTQDSLRIAIFSARGSVRGAFGEASASAEIRKGLDFGGASVRGDAGLSRPDANPQATVLRLSAEGRTRSWRSLYLTARLEAQYSSASLVAGEEFAWGELTIGRGFQPGAALGDKAIGGSVELRTEGWKVPYGVKAQPFVYADVARLQNNDPYGVADRTLASLGGGVRFDLAGRGRLDLTYAQPQEAAQGLGDRKPSPSIRVNFTVGLDSAFDFVRRNLFRGR